MIMNWMVDYMNNEGPCELFAYLFATFFNSLSSTVVALSLPFCSCDSVSAPSDVSLDSFFVSISSLFDFCCLVWLIELPVHNCSSLIKVRKYFHLCISYQERSLRIHQSHVSLQEYFHQLPVAHTNIKGGRNGHEPREIAEVIGKWKINASEMEKYQVICIVFDG